MPTVHVVKPDRPPHRRSEVARAAPGTPGAASRTLSNLVLVRAPCERSAARARRARGTGEPVWRGARDLTWHPRPGAPDLGGGCVESCSGVCAPAPSWLRLHDRQSHGSCGPDLHSAPVDARPEEYCPRVGLGQRRWSPAPPSRHTGIPKIRRAPRRSPLSLDRPGHDRSLVPMARNGSTKARRLPGERSRRIRVRSISIGAGIVLRSANQNREKGWT
jgi:hypothetical protein